MNEKAIYTQKTQTKSNAAGRAWALLGIIAAVIVLLFAAQYVAYTGILTLAVFAAAAFAVNKLLNKTVFDVTYELYEDRLVFVRKYGKMKWENEVFPLDEARFFEDAIEHRGRKYDFEPDEKMKELLGI